MKSIIVLVVVLGPAVAYSATPHCPEPEKTRARELFRSGKTDYELRRLVEAEKAFAESYKICPMPDLLFNLGQVNRELGRAREARHYYVQFLETAPPNNPNRAAAEEFALKMNELVKQQEKSAQEPPKGVLDSEQQGSANERPLAPRGRQRPWFSQPTAIGGWVTLGLGVAILGAGGGLIARQVGLWEEAATAMNLGDQRRLANESRTFEATGYSLLGLGSAVVLTGSVLVGVAASRRKSSVSADIFPGPERIVVALGGAF